MKGITQTGGDMTERSEIGSSEDSLREAAQEFRSAARLEAEEDEREASQLARRSRSLSQVALEAMHRGDDVTAGVADRTFTGHIVYTSGDLMTVETRAGLVDFNLGGPVYLRIAEPARSGGAVGRADGPGSFRGRLLEIETYPGDVEIGSPLLPSGLRGRVRVVAKDHLVLVDASDQEWFVPLSWTGYIARPTI